MEPVSAHRQSDYTSARSLLEEALVWRALGDQRGIATSLNHLGLVADDQGDYARASSLHEQSLEIARALGDPSRTASLLLNLRSRARTSGPC